MIVIFHILCNWLTHSWQKFYKSKNVPVPQAYQEDNGNRNASAIVDVESKVIFDPPVYLQRYAEVQTSILNTPWLEQIRNVVDFGCAELGFFTYIKKLIHLDHVVFVDADAEMLQQYSSRILPSVSDYLNVRQKLFTVTVLNGSVSDPDFRVIDANVVTAIELIEHLYPDTLDALPYNIFSVIRPYVAIFTTPNADFNVLFDRMSGFRHYDHKFEWTRSQFQDWANNITERYPEYTVKYKGIGPGPPGTHRLGCCSQMAVFELISDNNCSARNARLSRHCQCVRTSSGDGTDVFECNCSVDFESYGVCTYYTCSAKVPKVLNVSDGCVSKYESFTLGSVKYSACDYYNVVRMEEYPFRIDNSTMEEKVLQNCVYNIHNMGAVNGRYFNELLDRAEIPLYILCSCLQDTAVSISQLGQILKEAKWEIVDCNCDGEITPCVIKKMEYSDYNTSSFETEDSDDEEYTVKDAQSKTTYDDHNSDWDNDLDAINISNEQENRKTTYSGPSTPDDDESITHIKYKNYKLVDAMFDVEYNREEIPIDILNEVPQKLDKGPEVVELVHVEVHANPPFMDYHHQQVDYREIRHHLQQEIVVVENGDLANNNRDNEGNNYQAERDDENVVENDNARMQLEDVNEDDDGIVVADPVEYIDEELDDSDGSLLQGASKEALFDPDSTVSLLLEDVDEVSINEDALEVIGRPIRMENSLNENVEEQALVALHADPFPRWLVDLLTTESDFDDDDLEPHFLCQGDGMNVHPTARDLDDDSGTDSNSQTSADEEWVDPVASNVSILQETSSDEYLDVTVAQIAPTETDNLDITSVTETESCDEFFDTIDGLNTTINVEIACQTPNTSCSTTLTDF